MSEVIIVALFDRYASACEAVREIVKSGTSPDRISALANSLNGDHPALSTNPAYARDEIETKDQAQPGYVTGAEFGIGLGGIVGILASTGSIAIPGIGALIAAGGLATIAAGAATGGVVGGIIGLLTGQGITDSDAHLYAEGLKRGGTLITVSAEESAITPLDAIFKRYGAVDIEKRGAAWSAEGWVSFDPTTGPLSDAELNAEREAHKDDDGSDCHHARHYFTPKTPDSQGAVSSSSTTHYAEDELRQ